MNKNEFSRKMINECYEEMAAVAEENAKLVLENSKAMENITAFPVNTDPLWDNWYDCAFLYEPECTKDIEPVAVQKHKETDEFEDLFDYEPVYVPNSRDKRRMRVYERRKNTALHKCKVSSNVRSIWNNYTERSRTDMLSWSFQKRKNGERIDDTKSQENKTDKLLKRALKINAIPEELREKITEHLKKHDEVVRHAMSNIIYYERYYRGIEERVNRELDQMTRAGINIFKQRTRLELRLLLNREVA